MSSFIDRVNSVKLIASENLKRWEKDEKVSEIMREFLNIEGDSGKSKWQELLDEQHKIALNSMDPEVRLKAIESALKLAAGKDQGGKNNAPLMPVNIVINGVSSMQDVTHHDTIVQEAEEDK